MGVCNCSMFCCTLRYVHSSIAIILMGKRELIALLNLSSWCLVMVERLFLAVPRVCLQFLIVVLPDHTHLLFLLKTDKFTQSAEFWSKNVPLVLTNKTSTHTLCFGPLTPKLLEFKVAKPCLIFGLISAEIKPYIELDIYIR